MPYICLFAGILCGALSLLWVLHIVLYMLITPSLSLFLNGYFMFFDSFFPLLGTMSVALFAG